MPVAWTQDLHVGVAHIDAQHQELFARAASFLAAAERGEGERHVLVTLGYLSGYAATHFEDEERLMRETGYPELAAHAREHQAFQATLHGLTMAFARHGLSGDLAAATGRELAAWLDDHVRTTDRALGHWVRGRGPA
jgi:hemerythrin